jgi:hypothetical protein
MQFLSSTASLLSLSTILLTTTTLGFSPSHHQSSVKITAATTTSTSSSSPFRHEESFSSADRVNEPWSRLNMAFKSSEEQSNIFDGPMALTKERDACGVGFVSNTQNGGKLYSPIKMHTCSQYLFTVQCSRLT